MTRPRPAQLLQVTWDCAYMPGNICCFTTRTPLPPHSEHEWMSPSDAAPEPRQWSHSTRFLIMNCAPSQRQRWGVCTGKKKLTHVNAGSFVHVLQRDLEFCDGRGPTPHLLLSLDCVRHYILSAIRRDWGWTGATTGRTYTYNLRRKIGRTCQRDWHTGAGRPRVPSSLLHHAGRIFVFSALSKSERRPAPISGLVMSDIRLSQRGSRMLQKQKQKT
jgi:hypothetical protein